MLNVYSIDAINAALQEVPKEDRLSADGYIRKSADRTLPDDAALGALFSSDFNSKTALITEEGRRAERRSLSEQAWERITYLLSLRAFIERPKNISSHIENLLRPEEPEYNKTLLKAVENKDFKTQAKAYDEYLQGQSMDYDPEKLLAMPDEELVGQLETLYILCTAARAAARMPEADRMGLSEHLSEASKERLQKLSEDLPVLSSLMARCEMICNPCYEKVDVSKLMEEGNVLEKAHAAVGHLEKGTAEAGFFTQLMDMSSYTNQLLQWKMTNELRKNGFDLSTLTIKDMRQKDYSLNSAFGPQLGDLKKGNFVICRDNAGHIMAFRPDGGEFAPAEAKHLVDNVLHDSMTAQVDALVNLATGKVADPFWMMTGSSQYRDLKSALDAYAKVAKTASHPPKLEEFADLGNSLDTLEEAAQNYLKYKDPGIKDNMSFEQYMEIKGNSLNMNEREIARLQAAFFARDISRLTRGSLASSQELGIKNTQVMAVDHTFYQGLLRKYNAIEKELQAQMNGENSAKVAEDLERLMMDEKMYNDDRNPYPDNPVATLLWDMRQMTDLIERTETAMGLRMQERAIDPKEKARADALRKVGGTDVASFSMDALKKQLESGLEAAAKAQAQPQKNEALKLDYSPTEFVVSKKLMESRIARSNSSKEVMDYFEEEKANLTSREKALLQHRIKCLQLIEAIEKNNPSHPPKNGYTAERNGQPVLGEPQVGDKIMLPGVHERRSQNTMNGCWSVSICSQLEYRGINLPQEVIRAYRPGEHENLDAGKDQEVQYYSNRKQNIADYNPLITRMLPNSCLIQSGFMWSRNNPAKNAETKETFKQMVFHALVKDNSPVSICAGGHYMTIVGMEGDKVFLKNPMHINPFGDPEAVETWTFDQLAKKGGGQLEINWISDVTPTLGGNIEPDKYWLKEGVFYGNGRPSGNVRDEVSDPVKPTEIGTVSAVYFERPGGRPQKMSVFQPFKLSYNRIPGGDYNADVLKNMEKELYSFYKSGPDSKNLSIPGTVGNVLEEMGCLQAGVHKDDPHGGMVALAEKYIDALSAVRKAQEMAPSAEMKELQDTLSQQLKNVHKAIFDSREAHYKHLLGTENMRFFPGREETCPKGIDKKTYAQSKIVYRNLEQGLAGMVYFHQAKSFDLEDKQWITAMRPDKAQNGITQIKDGGAFQNMMDEIYTHAKEAEFYMTEEFDAYKEHLSRQAGNEKKNVNKSMENIIKTFADSFSPAEAQQKLEELEAEKQDRIEKAFLTEKDFAQSSKNWLKTQMQRAANLRMAVRDGNTTGLFNRYLSHQQKINVNSKAPAVKKGLPARKIVKTAPAKQTQQPKTAAPTSKP